MVELKYLKLKKIYKKIPTYKNYGKMKETKKKIML